MEGGGQRVEGGGQRDGGQRVVPPASCLLPPSSFLLLPASSLLPPASCLFSPSLSFHPPPSWYKRDDNGCQHASFLFSCFPPSLAMKSCRSKQKNSGTNWKVPRDGTRIRNYTQLVAIVGHRCFFCRHFLQPS
jgi:hypothetical protein